MRGVQHRTGDQEEQALEGGMIQTMVEHRCQRQRRQRSHAEGLEGQGQADADEEQADVLDRGISQEPLHVALHGGEDDAEQRRDQAQREDRDAPPPQGLMEQVEGNPEYAVDRGLEHDPAHHRRNRRRGGRVRLGQPDVQRQQACFGAEAEQGEGERGAGPEGAVLGVAHVGESVAGDTFVSPALQHAEAEQDADRADMSDQEIEIAGAADLGDAVVGGDQEERRQGHRFPGHHEGVGVIGEQH